MSKTKYLPVILLSYFLLLVGCSSENKNESDDKPFASAMENERGTYGYDKKFLKSNYENAIVLESEDGKSSIVVSPELQGRVMTSTLEGDDGMSFGWLNYDLIRSKKVLEHFNPAGGEERFWLGPEGGQFSLYFKPGASFEFDNWYVPREMDTEGFTLVGQTGKSASFSREMTLTNYTGTVFNMKINRKVELLDIKAIAKNLGLDFSEVSAVAYRTTNAIENAGENPWTKATGAPSVWLLSMMTCSPGVTIVAPIKQGSDEILGNRVNDDYFGKIAAARLKSTEQAVFFKADGTSRGKIGVSPKRAREFIGSYDAENEVLTILQITKPNPADGYVNSAWEIQKNPFAGDVLNAYNDGPLEDGTQMGPFYELESSSPALLLKPGEKRVHTQTIYHFKGTNRDELDRIAGKVLGVSLQEIQSAL